MIRRAVWRARIRSTLSAVGLIGAIGIATATGFWYLTARPSVAAPTFEAVTDLGRNCLSSRTACRDDQRRPIRLTD